MSHKKRWGGVAVVPISFHSCIEWDATHARGSRGTSDMAAQASMAELFGSDSEDEGEERQPAAPAGEATGDAGGDDADAASDLFGSDDDDDGEEAPAVGPLPNSAAPVTFAIPSMPRPSADSKVSARCHAPTLANYRDTAH